MKRKQFTFYRSFYEALECLPKAQQLEFLRAIIAYALDGEEPVLRTKMQEGQFALIRPVLKKSRQKAACGLLGAEVTNSFAVPKKSGKRIGKGEIEIETEKETEIETETETETEVSVGGFEEFWGLYPRKIGKSQARLAWTELQEKPEVVLASLREWCRSPGWKKEGGRFVPYPEKWLRQGYFLEKPQGGVPRGATGELGEAELEAIRRVLKED